MLVSGVRSSWLASATNCRWRSSIAWVSTREAVSARSISSRVRPSSATSSSVSGTGTEADGSRVLEIERAAAVRRVIGASDRRARKSPPKSASAVPARTPPTRKIRTRRTVASTSDARRAYCTKTGITGLRIRGVAQHRAPRLHAEVADLVGAVDRLAALAEVRGVARLADDPPGSAIEHADDRIVGRRVGVEAGLDDRDPALEVELQPVAQGVDGRGELVVEVAAHARGGELPDDDREQGEDREGERGGDDRQPPADRQPGEGRGTLQLRHATRTPLRGWCAGAAVRRRPRACAAGSRRTPRSCWSSRTGRSPRRPPAAAGGGRRCARCA